MANMAEIQAVLANRSGGRLRDRKGPIHPRRDALKKLIVQFKQAIVHERHNN